MKGYIKKEYMAYIRRTSMALSIFSTYILCLALMFLMRNEYSLYCVTLLMMPLSCCIANNLKEIDTESACTRYALTLPYSWKDIVKGRFLVGYVDWSFQCLCGLTLVLLHYGFIRTFSLPVYLAVWAIGVAYGFLMASYNTMISFLGGMVMTSALFLLAIFVGGGLYLLLLALGISPVDILQMNRPLLTVLGLVFVAGLSYLCYRVALWRMGAARRRA